MNVQFKSKSIIGVLFLVAFLLVLLRITKRSETMKTRLPKAMSIFWLFTTISLYLDLNLLSLDTKPYSKLLFLGLTALDQH